ncbi:MAG: hypothetical protein HZC18_05275 [Candidatus Omnitrophica bacterium]|nr:hypothetical protein [Candidatus Omnitrophota bacterium]
MKNMFKESLPCRQAGETNEFKKSTAEVRAGVVSIAAMLNKHGRGEMRK